MDKYFRFLILNMVLIIFLVGCTAIKLIKENNNSWKYSKFSSKLPIGWVKYASPGNVLSLTKDGEYLQNISIGKTKTGRELPNTKRKVTEDLLLQELAQIMIDEFSLTEGIASFEVMSQRPANIAGVDAFQLEFKYSNTDLVKYHGIIYGFIYKKKYYEIEYRALEQHYHAESVSEIDSFIKNFKVEE